MTSPHHRTGSERVAEVAARIDDDLIVNVQGDEPLLAPEMIDDAVARLCRRPVAGDEHGPQPRSPIRPRSPVPPWSRS